jgi:coproporphyrinogen III oxidase-like Fe-S oxidoreductase
LAKICKNSLINNLKAYLSRELIEIDGDYIKLSPSGMDLANQVFMEFI